MSGKIRVLRTVVRDCLYLNWALPRGHVPELPGPLRYEEHMQTGERYCFASALLFRHEHLHLVGLPFLRLSYPQLNLRFYVRDHEDVPSVFFHRILVPGWVVPSARWVAHQPAEAAHFSYPQGSFQTRQESWSWEVVRGSSLRLSASRSAPRSGAGPVIGSWNETIEYFRQRTRGYVSAAGGLQPVETTQTSVLALPMQVSVQEPQLLLESLGLGEGSAWPETHSAWLCPEVPYEFELSAETVSSPLRAAAPAPAAPGSAMFESRSRAAPRVAA